MFSVTPVSRALLTQYATSSMQRRGMSTIADIANKTISLAAWHHRYLCCDDKDRLTADRTRVSTWEKFEVIPSGGDKVGLKTHTGKYLSARSNHSVATMPHLQSWEQFKVEDHGPGRIALKTAHNRYLKAESKSESWEFDVNASASVAGPWEKFTCADVYQPKPSGSVRFPLAQLPRQSSYPAGQNEWICGVISATRMLNAYQHGVNVTQMIEEIGPLEIVGHKLPVGKPPGLIVEKIQQYEPAAAFEFHVTFDFVKKLLAEGKPVATLLYLGKKHEPTLDMPIPNLHWVVLSGFDDAASKLSVYDPADDEESSLDYGTFLQQWKWHGWKSFDEPDANDKLTDFILYSIDHLSHRNTIFWVDRPAPQLDITGSGVEQFKTFYPSRYMPSVISQVSGSGVTDCHADRAYSKFKGIAKHALGVGEEDLFIDYGVISKTHRGFWRNNWPNGRSCQYNATGVAYATKV